MIRCVITLQKVSTESGEMTARGQLYINVASGGLSLEQKIRADRDRNKKTGHGGCGDVDRHVCRLTVLTQ